MSRPGRGTLPPRAAHRTQGHQSAAAAFRDVHAQPALGEPGREPTDRRCIPRSREHFRTVNGEREVASRALKPAANLRDTVPLELEAKIGGEPHVGGHGQAAVVLSWVETWSVPSTFQVALGA